MKERKTGDKTVARRKNELFKRIKTGTLAKIISHDTNTESIYNIGQQREEDETKSVASSVSNKTDFTSVSSFTKTTEQIAIDVRAPKEKSKTPQ